MSRIKQLFLYLLKLYIHAILGASINKEKTRKFLVVVIWPWLAGKFPHNYLLTH